MLARVRRNSRYTTTHDTDSDFDGGEAYAPPGGADGVGVYVAEDVDGAVDAEDGKDGTAYVCQRRITPAVSSVRLTSIRGETRPWLKPFSFRRVWQRKWRVMVRRG